MFPVFQRSFATGGLVVGLLVPAVQAAETNVAAPRTNVVDKAAASLSGSDASRAAATFESKNAADVAVVADNTKLAGSGSAHAKVNVVLTADEIGAGGAKGSEVQFRMPENFKNLSSAKDASAAQENEQRTRERGPDGKQEAVTKLTNENDTQTRITQPQPFDKQSSTPITK